jgi:RND family efflux transporter MFP subunit
MPPLYIRLTMKTEQTMTRFIFFIFIFSVMVSCSQNPKENASPINPASNVEIDLIQRDSLSIPVFAAGTLSSRTQSNLSFMTGGIIDRIYVSEGDLVREGQRLAKLDLTEINSRVKQALVAYEKAQRDFQRAENLYRDTVITLEQYQNARTALEIAETSYQIADFNRSNSEIRAPSDGKILKKLKESPEMTAPGHPVIVFASTETDWVLKVNLADKDIVQIAEGDSAIIGFDAYPGMEFPAEVYEIANAANIMSGTYEVDLKLLRQPERLVTGLIGQATIYPETESHLFMPPEGLVEAVGDEGIIFTIKEGKAVRKEIILGTITQKGIIIREGLGEGDTVIVNGNAWLREGENIKVMNNLK